MLRNNIKLVHFLSCLSMGQEIEILQYNDSDIVMYSGVVGDMTMFELVSFEEYFVVCGTVHTNRELDLICFEIRKEVE